MAEEKQPPNLVEGATGDIEDEIETTAKSAEDRKAAAALSKLDAHRDDDTSTRNGVDQEAFSRAMNTLGGDKKAAAKDVKKVKVDPADVTLLVDELEVTKAKATELLKAHDGDAVKTLRAYISAPAA